MSETRTVFTILEDNTTAEGVKLPARAEGDAKGGNHAPVIDSVDSSGNYILNEKRTQGQAASGVSMQPSLGAKDLAGDLQLINQRLEGAAASGVNALPGLVAKDPSGNLIYLKLNADGELITSQNGGGIKKYGYAVATPSAINTLTTVINVVLTASKVHEDMEVRASCSFPTMWEICSVDDAAGTPVVVVLDSFLTGPGQFTFAMKYEGREFSSSATGVQQLRLRATQLQGSPSDMHGYVAALEKL